MGPAAFECPVATPSVPQPLHRSGISSSVHSGRQVRQFPTTTLTRYPALSPITITHPSKKRANKQINFLLAPVPIT